MSEEHSERRFYVSLGFRITGVNYEMDTANEG